ncbi:MAG TPA: hypothetical protein VMI06_00270 [Terriglobia bacterium]|nr:hypothetical protein [Terriglobia bacterium]
MGENVPRFTDLMVNAHRVTVALDALTVRDGSKTTTAAVTRGRRVYAELLDHQKTAWMTKPEAHALQTALDQLQARLRFFGESI